MLYSHLCSDVLVVKGGDTDFDKGTPNGISRDVVREFLSGQGILDFIQKNIPHKGTREAIIEAGEIHGPNSGDLKRRNDARAELANIDELLESINSELAEGNAIAATDELAQAENRIENLETAKRYAAFLVAQKKAEVDAEIQRFEDAKFRQTDKNFEEYSSKQEFLKSKQDEREQAHQRGMHYPWLEDAVREYQNHLGQTGAIGRPTLLIVAGLLLIVSIVLTLFGQKWPALFFILLSALFGFMYYQQARSLQVNQASAQELEKIRSAYREKFNEPCKDISSMNVKLRAIAVDYHAVQQIEKDIGKAESELQSLTHEIQQGLLSLEGNKVLPSKWEKTVSRYRRTLSGLLAQSGQLEKDLIGYDVDSSDFSDTDPGIPYSRNDYAAAIDEQKRLQEAKSTLEQSLLTLRSEVQAVVKDHLTTDWAELIHKLRELRLEKLEEYKLLTTAILAGNLLSQAIDKVRQDEDDKILQNLDSEGVRDPLRQLSKHYASIEMDADAFVAIDEFGQAFNFSQLSTGTREQILLALRIGFAKKVLQGNTAFLILDDAFQHSDWERRPGMVDTVFELAKQDWQIIYFSMDDNIRDLFDQRGKNAPKGAYTRIDL